MSDGNKRNDDFQDYLDLLDEFSDPVPKSVDNYDNETQILPPFEEMQEFYLREETLTGDLTENSNENSVGENQEDILSNTPKEKNPFKRLWTKYKNLPKKKKIIVTVIAVVLALLIIVGSVLGIFVVNKFSLLGGNVAKDDFDDIIYEDEDFGSIDIDIGSAGFKQSLIDWATAGNNDHMSSKNVLNVLLVGADSRKGVNEGNTDVMMLVSLNKKTKQIKLVSFLRDSYLYIEGDNNSYCTKLNAAYSMGGPKCLMKTIENNYKIDIDNYVMVNFESFKSIIDAMGGVTVDVQKYEADYNYQKFKVTLPYGDDVTLNGEQALCFCRIRGCDADGDVSRTRRQRQVIEAIIQKVSTASLGDLNKYIDILLPYIETGFTNSEILSLGMKALTGKWYSYEQSQIQMPDEECRTSGSANAWIWVVDYQLAAHKLQKELYGESNIVIDEDRISIIDVYRGANYSGSSSSSSSSSSNSNSGSGSNSSSNSSGSNNSSSSSNGSSNSNGSSSSYKTDTPATEVLVKTTQSVTEKETQVETSPETTQKVPETEKSEPTTETPTEAPKETTPPDTTISQPVVTETPPSEPTNDTTATSVGG